MTIGLFATKLCIANNLYGVWECGTLTLPLEVSFWELASGHVIFSNAFLRSAESPSGMTGTFTVYSSLASEKASPFSRETMPLSSALKCKESLALLLCFSMAPWTPANKMKLYIKLGFPSLPAYFPAISGHQPKCLLVVSALDQ